MNKQWMALLLSTGIAVTACPVPAAQMPPAEQIHGEAEETSVPVQHDDSDDRETANEFQSDTEPSQSETDDGAAGNEEENNEESEKEKKEDTEVNETPKQQKRRGLLSWVRWPFGKKE